MPPIGFKCPDGERILFSECYAGCRMADQMKLGRCKALPFLRKAAYSRPWSGNPSTTQLITGTREAYLKITADYYIQPDNCAYRILGTNAHYALQRLVSKNERAEERIVDKICSGQYDFYEPVDGILWDYKTWSAWKVMACLGLKAIEEPVYNAASRPVTARKNKPKRVKMQKKFIEDPVLRATSILDTSIQLSDYRDKLRQELPQGFEVKKLAVQAIVRDGGLVVSLKRGSKENAVVIPVNGVSPHWVKKFFSIKRQRLFEALETGNARLCSRRQRWGGRKCTGFCEVNEACIAMPGWESEPLLKKKIIRAIESPQTQKDNSIVWRAVA